MRGKVVFGSCLLGCLALSTWGWAQEGHPLSGTWHGSVGANRAPVVMYMKWDSKNIVGIINPGPDAIPMKVATLDPSKWAVHFEADTKDSMHIVIDGKLDNIG